MASTGKTSQARSRKLAGFQRPSEFEFFGDTHFKFEDFSSKVKDSTCYRVWGGQYSPRELWFLGGGMKGFEEIIGSLIAYQILEEEAMMAQIALAEKQGLNVNQLGKDKPAIPGMG